MRVVKLHSLIKNDAIFQNSCQAFLTNFFVFPQLFFILFSPLPFCVSLAPFLLYFFAFLYVLLCYYGHFCGYYARVLNKVFITLLPLGQKEILSYLRYSVWHNINQVRSIWGIHSPRWGSVWHLLTRVRETSFFLYVTQMDCITSILRDILVPLALDATPLCAIFLLDVTQMK